MNYICAQCLSVMPIGLANSHDMQHRMVDSLNLFAATAALSPQPQPKTEKDGTDAK